MSSNKNIDWNINIIERFKEKLNWRLFASNEGVTWTDKIIEKFEKELDSEYNIRNSNMSERLLWSYDKYEEKNSDWKILSSNHSVQWSESLIDKHSNKLYWDILKNNISLPWSLNFICKYSENLNESSIIWDILKTDINDELIHTIFMKIKNANPIINIAGKLTTKDWVDLVPNLNSEKDENWGLAFHFFEERIRTRYLNPIHAILKMEDNLGEGFAILNLQCSLIETIECFINGWVFNDKKDLDNKVKKNKWYKRNVVKADIVITDITGEDKTLTNKDIFINFFKTNEIFKTLNIDGNCFYENVRCGLLHETQTKDNWRIKSDSKKSGLGYEENNDRGVLEKIIYRENFQKDLETLIKNYKKSIIDRTAMDGIPAFELRENFIAKFNHICKES